MRLLRFEFSHKAGKADPVWINPEHISGLRAGTPSDGQPTTLISVGHDTDTWRVLGTLSTVVDRVANDEDGQ